MFDLYKGLLVFTDIKVWDCPYDAKLVKTCLQ